jgi:hypothetical protein
VIQEQGLPLHHEPMLNERHQQVWISGVLSATRNFAESSPFRKFTTELAVIRSEHVISTNTLHSLDDSVASRPGIRLDEKPA